MAREIEPTNRYRDVLLKLIPTEIVGAYMVTDGLIPREISYGRWIALGAFVFLLGLTPFYLRKLYRIQNWSQIVFTTCSFVIWVYWMGGPFKLWGVHIPPLASVILILWTLLIPLLNMPSKFNRGQTVQILMRKPESVTGKKFTVVWDQGMTKYMGKTAQVTKVDGRKQAVKLDADGGEYWWSFEWIRPKHSSGEKDDGSESV